MSSSSGDDWSTQAFGSTHSEGVIEKKIGQPAGLNCPEEPNLPCDLNFNLTAIQQNAPCGGESLGPDEQYLRFDVDAFSSDDTFEYADSGEGLLLSN